MTTPPPGWSRAPRHPDATTVLVLGILGIVLCGVLAPIAWFMGTRVLREIDADPGLLDGRGEVNAGRILGIVGTAMLVLGLLAAVALLGLLAVGATVVGTSSTTLIGA
ncbi:hypothetical protein ASD11_11715 [Aeromicrobium sp. Root495]|uniref:DUF4190 domain-containing protein n=1 Tax=Aeromicrobium sp. Root495 TaxID=1736550 RepID=UPI0006FB387D|nr:DUF4190 domain-containing protein [Aeromicrobium sp. Root495]KQY60146.1 hypothetical protein ASD11_11715 [Aeromicrobium sp. Root495]